MRLSWLGIHRSWEAAVKAVMTLSEANSHVPLVASINGHVMPTLHNCGCGMLAVLQQLGKEAHHGLSRGYSSQPRDKLGILTLPEHSC